MDQISTAPCNHRKDDIAEKLFHDEVVRWGGVLPWTDDDGRNINVSHKDVFPADKVVLDGLGNVTDMPLLRRKPCFGKPYIFYRHGFWKKKAIVLVDKLDPVQSVSRCYQCPVRDACVKVCRERVKSDQEVTRAFGCWFRADIGIPTQMETLAENGGRLWDEFLASIIARGPWQNVNDQCVLLDDLARRRAEKDRRNAGKRKRRLVRNGKCRRITPDFLSAINAERDRWFEEIKRLKAMTKPPKELSRKDAWMLVETWRAIVIIKREGRLVTGDGIAKIVACADTVSASHVVRASRYRAHVENLSGSIFNDFHYQEPTIAVHDDDFGDLEHVTPTILNSAPTASEVLNAIC